MGTVTLKLFFNIVLMFTVPTTVRSKDTQTCSSLADRLLPLTKVQPLKYNIQLKVRPFIKIMSGQVDIVIDVKESIKTVNMHALGFEINEEQIIITAINTVEDSVVFTSKPKRVQYCDKDNILILIFEKVLNPGQYSLHIEYTSMLDANENIFYAYSLTKNANK